MYNIKHHNRRCNKARKDLFHQHDPINLRKFIHVPKHLTTGLLKCRIKYKADIEEITYEPYEIRRITNVAIVDVGNISYAYKFFDRSALQAIRNQHSDYDEIIMIKNGQLTDAYYYNIVLKIEHEYLTPKNPLLEGTMRSKLLEKGQINERDLTVDDLKASDEIYLINALTPLGKITIRMDQIEFKT